MKAKLKSTLFILIVLASPIFGQEVSNVFITGNFTVGSVLTGNYTALNVGTNTIVMEWFSGAPRTPIGTGTSTYTIQGADLGKNIWFKVSLVNSIPAVVDADSSAYSSPVGANATPVATSPVIFGEIKTGRTLYASYFYSDLEGDLEENSQYQWYTGTSSTGDGSQPINLADTTFFHLTLDQLGFFIGFSVTPAAKTGTTPGNTKTTITWVGPITNNTPTASSVSVSGTLDVNDVLLGNYTYFDADGDLEGTSTYEWWISDYSDGSDSVAIGSTNARTYKLRMTDQGKYLMFTVLPKAVSGSTPGTKVVSAPVGPVNSAPVASTPYISGTPAIDTTLKAKYTFSDPDPADSEGTSTFKWYRDNVLVPGAVSNSYLLTTADINTKIHFEVTPVSSTGFPNTGATISSAQTDSVKDLSGGKPRAENLCINGARVTDSILVGRYTFNDPFYSNSGTKFFWIIGTTRTNPSTNNTYKVKAADMGKDIVFAVIPKNSGGIVGDTAYSSSLARITLPYQSISIADPGVVLQATPGGGFFDGPGVSSGKFLPTLVGIGGPYTINYRLNFLTCTQNAYTDVTVNDVNADFTSFKPVYCYGSGYDTIYVVNVDPLATARIFKMTEPSAIVSTLSDTSIVIDISRLRAGDKRDTLFYTYTAGGSPYPIYRPFVIDSIGEVKIENLTTGDVFCNNDVPFILYTNFAGGTFSGPVAGNLFTPSLGLGAESVGYNYVSSTTGCSRAVSVPVTINASPQVSFTVADVCIEYASDSTKLLNNTVSADPVQKWEWAFFEGGAVGVSELEEPNYLYITGGLHKVRLTATTTENCTDYFETNVDLGIKPNADFYWLNECFRVDDSLSIFDRTTFVTPITSRTWNFFDGGPLVTRLNPKIIKNSPGYKPVEYIVYTNYLNCYDTVRKDIFVRPTIDLIDSDDYFEDFESGPGGWISDPGPVNSWTLGTPDRPTIDAAASGLNAWYTDYAINNQKVQSSSVSSPCFDFTDSERPMISIRLWRRFDRNRDGAALQYKIGDSPDWEYLGTIDDGINWYNSTQIKGRPGGDQIGWTTIVPDSDWIVSSHRLDELVGSSDVKFRIAYGSDGTSQDNDGLAFDDIRISTRSRLVLLEHFTNNSSVAAITGNDIVSDIVDEMDMDVINIQYHTSFPGTDKFYWDIPSEMSARILFYGLSKIPWASVDGGTGELFNGVFSFSPQEISDPDVYRNMLIKRSLVSPKFELDIDPIMSSEGQLSITTSLKALEDINAENLTLYISVIAKEITSVTGANGETRFINTLRRMLPDAGGTNLPKTWARGQTFDSGEFGWKVQNLYDATDIEIVAFVQNNVTHEILQAISSEIDDITVGVENIYGTNGAFTIYPNPTGGNFAVSFDEPLTVNANIEIIDFKGTVVKRYTSMAGQAIFNVEDVGLTNGIYMVRISSDGRTIGMKKLLVSAK